MGARLSAANYRPAAARWRARRAKVAALRIEEWGVLAEALLTLPLVSLALHTVQFPRVLSWANRADSGRGAQLSREHVERTAWLVGVSTRFMPFKCLTRSLTLARVLGRRGVATDVRIGVRTEDGRLLAHAWIEWSGRVLNDTERALEPFARFERIVGDTLHV